jgi:hypothetical protein
MRLTGAIQTPTPIPDRNIVDIAASQVRPGHVLVNGLVLAVEDLGFCFSHGTVECPDSPDQPVTVLGSVSPAILAAARYARGWRDIAPAGEPPGASD